MANTKLGAVICKCKNEYISQVTISEDGTRMSVETPCNRCGFHPEDQKILKAEMAGSLPKATIEGPKKPKKGKR